VSIRDQTAPIAEAILGASLGAFTGFPAALVESAIAGEPQPPHCRALNAAIAADPNDPRLTLTQEYSWIPEAARGETRFYHVMDVSLGRLQAQFDLVDPYWPRGNADARLEIEHAGDYVEPVLDFRAEGCGDGDADCHAETPKLVDGLVLRDAGRARLYANVCDASCNRTPASAGSFLTALPSAELDVPQFGNLFVVPVHSGFAQDAAASVAINTEGRITKLRMQNVSSLGDSLTRIGGQTESFAKNLPTAESAIADVNRRLADCLAAQQRVTEAGGTPVGTCR